MLLNFPQHNYNYRCVEGTFGFDRFSYTSHCQNVVDRVKIEISKVLQKFYVLRHRFNYSSCVPINFLPTRRAPSVENLIKVSLSTVLIFVPAFRAGIWRPPLQIPALLREEPKEKNGTWVDDGHLHNSSIFRIQLLIIFFFIELCLGGGEYKQLWKLRKLQKEFTIH